MIGKKKKKKKKHNSNKKGIGLGRREEGWELYRQGNSTFFVFPDIALTYQEEEFKHDSRHWGKFMSCLTCLSFRNRLIKVAIINVLYTDERLKVWFALGKIGPPDWD